MSASGAGNEALLDQFHRLSEKEQHEHILSLLELIEVHELRSLYNRIRVLLSFDILSQLPVELSAMVLSYLDARLLCAVVRCCHSWRTMANRDELWYELCRVKGYEKLSNLQRPAWAEHSRPTSPPRYTFPSLPTSSSSSSLPARDRLSPICRWWRVYAEAHVLQRNWAVGVYTAAPLLRGHNQRVACIAHEDDELVSGSCDGSVRVWCMDTLKCLHTLEGHTADVNCVVAKDGVIVTGCADGLVRVFDTRTGQCINSLHGHSGSVEHVVLSGRTLVSAGSDWWAVSETSLIWTPMGQNKVSVRVWDVHTGKQRHTLTGHTEEVEVLRLCGDRALSGSWDHSLRVWDTLTGICTHTLLSHTEVVSCCEGEWEMREGGRRRAVSGGGDSLVKLWDLQDGRELLSMAGHTAEVVCVQFNSSVMVSGSTDSKIRVWNYQGRCQWVLEDHIGVVRCLCLRGDRLVSGGDRKRIVVWDVKNGEKLHAVHRQQSLLHRMLVTDTKIITASPDTPGTISIISYW